ncbi:hypothetical protein WJX84_011792 [Apatococcus fuscideae]|uniref:Uncharacterized protein n=1 Tax=Apatococcus fuscideae TaxID=2026836 RepID=A0AAW1SYW8_9CHLO
MASQALDLAVKEEGNRFRKPYVVRKSREKWSLDEHCRFIEAVSRFGRQWTAIVEFIGTRSVAQVRSHAQKHFLKLQHQGRADAVPPPRPKRRSAKPYPVQYKDEAQATQSLVNQPPLATSCSADLGRGNSSGGHESNADSSTSPLPGQEESSEASVELSARPQAILDVQASCPGSCTLSSISALSDVGKLYQALDVVLQRPEAPSQHSKFDLEYSSQRATLVARLNQLRTQLDHQGSRTAPGCPNAFGMPYSWSQTSHHHLAFQSEIGLHEVTAPGQHGNLPASTGDISPGPGPAQESNAHKNCSMLRPFSFSHGLDLEGISPWTLDDAAEDFSAWNDGYCSNDSIDPIFDPTAWLQLSSSPATASLS